MEFKNRDVEFPEHKKLIKVDSVTHEDLGEEPIYVKMERAEGEVTEEGTPINAENLNKGNWRDDKSLSFTKLDNNTLPNAKANETQIVTKNNGETWLVPPASSGQIDTPLTVRDWTKLWTGENGAKAFDILDIFNTIPNPREIMFLVKGTNQNVLRGDTFPIYINDGGTRVQALQPDLTANKFNPLNWNAAYIIAQDGQANAYNLCVRVQSSTQINIYVRNNANLVGVLVR